MRMKAGITLAGILFCLLLAATSTSAALSASQSSIDFGSNSQEKVGDNGNQITLNQTITITATTNYQNINIVYNPENGVQQGDLTFSSYSPTLNATPMQVTLSLKIPRNFDAVDDDLDEEKFDIGSIAITGAEYNTTTGQPTGSTGQATIDLTLQVENKLELDKIEIDKDGSVSTITSSSTVTVDGGINAEFIFYIKNNFNNNTNVEFSTVSIAIDIEDIGDDTASLSNLDAGETKDKGIDFDIDEEEDGTFDVVIAIEGEDEFGGKHGMKHDFKLEVNPAPQPPEDNDDDGVPDNTDQCPTTPAFCTVNSVGCSLDKDNDGVCDAIDAIDNSVIIPTTQQEQENPVAKKTFIPANTSTETKSTKKLTDDGAYFLPFFLGFVIGAIISAGFFFLLRS